MYVNNTKKCGILTKPEAYLWKWVLEGLSFVGYCEVVGGRLLEIGQKVEECGS